MATKLNGLGLPYPLASDDVNVHGDIKDLVTKLEEILPPLGLSYFQISVRNETGSLISAGDPVYASGYSSGSARTLITKLTGSSTQTLLGLSKTNIANNANGVVVVGGVLEGLNTSLFSSGSILYVGQTGGLVSGANDSSGAKPANSGVAIGIVAHAGNPGIIIVQAKGNGTWGALKNGLA